MSVRLEAASELVIDKLGETLSCYDFPAKF
jgi:hypothetical protein